MDADCTLTKKPPQKSPTKKDEASIPAAAPKKFGVGKQHIFNYYYFFEEIESYMVKNVNTYLGTYLGVCMRSSKPS